MLDFFNESSSDKDLGKIRTLELDNNKINIKCGDDNPYGFWSIHFERGQMPEKLKGSYTSFAEAEKAVKLYLNEKKRTLKTA